MQLSVEQLLSDDEYWQQLCERLQTVSSLCAVVLTARQMGLWLARAIVQQQLHERAVASTEWSTCLVCHTRLVSKGFIERQMLMLVGQVVRKRRVGRCPHRCLGSQQIPFDEVLGIQAHQQTSTELMRLGRLLAVFLPFELASQVLLQLIGVAVSDDTIWNWVQDAGQRAMKYLQLQLQQFADGKLPKAESLDAMLLTMPLIIAADGVTVPFRRQPKSPKGKVLWQEVKIALLTRLGRHQTKTRETITRLHQRRLVAVLGDIDDLKLRLQLEALRQGITTAPQVVWISDGARGFWRLYRECFAPTGAVGILDFYHAVQHLWQAASAYHNGKESPDTSAVVCRDASSLASRLWQRHHQRTGLVEQVSKY